MSLLVNIDNGGTFTDICVSDGARIVHTKTATTPHDLTRCFADGLRLASTELFGEEDLAGLLRRTAYLRYSTTAGTNAMVERRGTGSGLLVEAGATEGVYGIGDLVEDDLWIAMVPFAPGEVVYVADDDEPTIDETRLIAEVNRLVAAGASRIVVSLRSAAAEHEVKNVLLSRYPRHLLGAVPFLLAHELADDPLDSRRTLTAVVNSYLHPGMEHFLYGAQSVVADAGLPTPLLVFGNDGNSARIAKTTALKTWGSGPRGGLEGAIAYARLYDLPALVTMDIGGTTTDVALVGRDTLPVRERGALDAASISFPLPELRSIGLGGSSVVTVVEGAGSPEDRIRIGPHSVGASPGPASFARGGTDATLTDALLVLGVLDAQRYLGGALPLDTERAAAAIDRHVGGPLGISTAAAARAVVSAFAGRAGEIIAEQVGASGVPADQVALLAFGGGGPVIASAVAEHAGISRVIVPRYAAVFSAYGVGFSNLAHEYVRAVPPGADVAGFLSALRTRAERDMFGEGVEPSECTYTLARRTTTDGLVRDVAVDASDVEAGWTIVLRAEHSLPSFALVPDEVAPTRDLHGDHTREVDGELVDVFDVDALRPGDVALGPALASGAFLTCWVDRGWRLRITANDDLILEQQ